MEAVWYGHFLLKVFWEGNGEASGDALSLTSFGRTSLSTALAN